MKSYILFYDSGIGGLSTLKQASLLMPSESFIYFADDKNMPYGNKPAASILKLILSNIKEIIKTYPIKLIVLSCNTATSVSKEVLLSKLSIPVVGIEPALLPASKASKTGEILCLATRATILGGKYRSLLSKAESKVHSAAMFNLAAKIEKGLLENNLDISSEIDFINKVLDKFPKIDQIVLGCTHYSLVKNELGRQLSLPLHDGNLGVARQTKRLLLKNRNLKSHGFLNLKIILSSGVHEKEKKYLNIFERL